MDPSQEPQIGRPLRGLQTLSSCFLGQTQMELATRSLTKLKDREAPWDFWVPKAGLRRDVLSKRKSSGGKSMTNSMRRGLRGSDLSKEARPAPSLFLLYCIGSAEGRREQPCSFSRLARGGPSPVEGIIHPSPPAFLKIYFLIYRLFKLGQVT